MYVVAANMQYKPIYEWRHVADAYSKSYSVDFKIYPLDAGTNIPGSTDVPESIVQMAKKLPRPQVAFCPSPVEGDIHGSKEQFASETGFIPALTAIYSRHMGLYWYGRTLFVQDEAQRVHYALLVASSESFSGNGLFFNLTSVLFIGCTVLVLSFLWWWPFVLHLTRPIAKLTVSAERMASGTYPHTDEKTREYFSLSRKDEIGRLSQAVGSMAAQIMRQMWGQRRFIRHIAHELGSPIARIKFGLAVLEANAKDENMLRIQRVIKDVELVSVMIEDVLTYLRAEGLPESPRVENFPLAEVLEGIIEVEGPQADVHLDMADRTLIMHSDIKCVRRAVGNTLRNAIRYAGESGPITIAATQLAGAIRIQVDDCGEGVPPDDLPHLVEPFFRGESAKKHSCGSGLGLSIVRHCIDLCGGTLRFANRTPHGFSVIMTFPLEFPRSSPQSCDC
jgi:two-component system sensor histidine kinase CpxA